MERNKVFIDTNVFVAELTNDDSLHDRALRLIARIEGMGMHEVTSNAVISETITILSQRVAKKTALIFADFIYGNEANVEIITVDRHIEDEALKYFHKAKSKNISFCDCTTLAILKEYGLAQIATFDSDFKKAKGSIKGDYTVLN